ADLPKIAPDSVHLRWSNCHCGTALYQRENSHKKVVLRQESWKILLLDNALAQSPYAQARRACCGCEIHRAPYPILYAYENCYLAQSQYQQHLGRDAAALTNHRKVTD